MATPPVDPTTAGAAAVLNAQLAAWGITGLGADVLRLLKQGLDSNALMIELENTDAYKKRFIGNEARQKAGLRALPPAEYVATETALKGVLRSFGMPKGFYDTNEDITKFIANDVSPAELHDRATVAQEVWITGPATNRQAWKSYYGLSDGAAIAAILDPTKALGLVQKQAAAAQLGGNALAQGLNVGRARAEDLVAAGVSDQQSQQGYSQIAGSMTTDQAIAQRFGGQAFTQHDEEDARLLGLASAQRKLRDLQGAESGLFSGHAAAGGGALSGSGTGQY